MKNNKKQSRLSIVARKAIRPFLNKKGVGGGDGTDEKGALSKVFGYFLFALVVGMILVILAIATGKFGSAKKSISDGLNSIETQMNTIK